MSMSDLSSYAMMFSNSNPGGKMPKKKSAAARQKAKAKGMKNAAYVALGQPAGKKTSNSGGKSSKGKGSGSKGSGSKGSSSSSKSMTNTGGSPYVTSAVTKATAIKNKAFTSPYVSVGSRSAKPSMSAADMKSGAALALGNPRTAQVRAKSTKTTSTTVKPKSTKTTSTTVKPVPSAKTNWR